MDLIEISKRITEKIQLLEKGRGLLHTRATRKATATANYEKALALTMVKLKMNAIDQVFGYDMENMPATLIEKVARGLVYAEKLEMELAIDEYKSAIVGMNAIESELNGYQSINRYLQHESN
jgi:hypothetical protein